ncbi:MAG: hypothetical protein UV41_C0047G0006 [Candidatus Daviesbacteria bacterium GW2011_GWA2_42_7]|uniref:Uncharacterized protein n=1 Tax=Candidatus Daviesbacteria bacterium GW2011_GWA2_42_7 TaxID=1618425 RepID=A0A0G1DFX2_9BACT|nr:MAG: hypothetical protein UV41_C0047G0006 [Candidatus Daviesbacteria bacterium GW2011_GWA2_42_7]OGE19745.1 MAG: hypothetical protein A2874_02410 [Candidatus Daviesbacteria bacterium RIFCSPHIGHO2_01_FULL_43_17]OGE70532.1 MAG: hypothetical protein A3J21_01100 [Candidatus Daviesbacteria bacterium RIFCSPLOWO2_02_FULL_43_11]
MNTKKFQITIIIVLVLLIGFLYFNNRETQNKVKIIETPKPIVSDLNVPDSWEDTSDNIEDYYKVYKNPAVLFLRKALNAYLNNDSSGINISNAAVKKETGEGIISGLESFDKEYYKSKFVVLTINKSISGGVDIQILFQDKPDRIFYAWVYQLADGNFELRGFNSKEEMKPEAMKAIQTEFKTFLEDKEHAL